MAGKLREALDAWEKIQAGEAEESASEATRLDVNELDRHDRFYPEGGLVLRVHTRDLPRDVPQEVRWADAWNLDFAWFKKEEIRQFLPDSPEPGQEHPVPQELVHRLVRLHFLDNVRGQTSPYRADAVKEASLTSRVTEIEGDEVVLRLEGRSRTEQQGRGTTRDNRGRERGAGPQSRGVDLDWLGFARFDLKQGRFVHFEVVAVGHRWGATQYNVRGHDLGPEPFGVVLSLAGEDGSDRVAPEHFWSYGWR